VDHGDHDPPWWTRSIQDLLGPHSDISLMEEMVRDPNLMPQGCSYIGVLPSTLTLRDS